MSYPTCPRCGHSWHALPCRVAVLDLGAASGWNPCECPADAPLPIPAAIPAVGPPQLPQETAA